MSNTAEKCAVVSGESSGIGQAITRALETHGITVHGMSRTSGVDVTSVEAVQRRYEEIGSPTPSLLVMSAGIIIPQTFPNVSYESWRRVMDVNLTGSFIVSQEHVRRLIDEKQSGKIMLIGSPSGRRPSMDNISYGVSKAAVSALGMGLARGLEPYDIQVYIVCPSHVDTPMLRQRGFSDLDELPLMQADEFAAEVTRLLTNPNTLDGQQLYFSHMVIAKQQ